MMTYPLQGTGQRSEGHLKDRYCASTTKKKRLLKAIGLKGQDTVGALPGAARTTHGHTHTLSLTHSTSLSLSPKHAIKGNGSSGVREQVTFFVIRTPSLSRQNL